MYRHTMIQSIMDDPVTLSPKYQVVIPQKIREQMKLEPGQRFRAFHLNGGIQLVPVKPIREMRGILRGMNTDSEREGDRIL